ncbi:MAG: heat-inducible transcription repressor HrcA [Candidatus Paraimprobicoccus trichonymphae]|uniref:Heat-inducible transcription repressor HrcA n=1 Tax=Candidatus Paraimprobicoccus trichonymphae TaxID=3033793 RepID=A0AA48HWK5_9FIRM|nr:MAG: heat-inducible transcription repressor HrcA [Candidatus Paraimprobicoccus trichonymphae]
MGRLELSKRKLKILSAVVEKYIKTGEPVSSGLVCDHLNFNISSATIRNEMVELAKFGFLEQPHTSSGRVPSCKGYRLFVDRAMKIKPISTEERNLISGILYSRSDDPESLIEKTSKILADITNFAVLLTSPSSSEARIRDIQFVQTGRKNLMIVLMTSAGMIKNKLFRCDYDVTPELIEIFSRLVSENFRNKLLNEISSESVKFLADYDSEVEKILFPIFNVLIETAQEAQKISIKLEGQNNLLTVPDTNTDDLMYIFSFLNNKKNILDLVSNLSKNKFDIYIGDELKYPELKNLSVIFTKYSIGDKFGDIGLIGPTRMDYGKLISKLKYISDTLGVILNKMLDL